MTDGAIFLTVNGEDVETVTLEVGKSYSVEVASSDGAPYGAYVGFDNQMVLGSLSHVQTTTEAGHLADVTEYDEPIFYGYYLSGAGFDPGPSAGVHFVFEYQPQQIGETDILLHDQTPGSMTGRFTTRYQDYASQFRGLSDGDMLSLQHLNSQQQMQWLMMINIMKTMYDTTATILGNIK